MPVIISLPKSLKERVASLLGATVKGDYLLVEDYNQLLERLKEMPFLARHINRVYPFTIASDRLDLSMFDFKEKIVRVVAPKKLQQQLLSQLEEKGVMLHPKQFSHFLSVFFDGSLYYYGLFPRSLFYRKPETVKPVSRAYFKLEEIFFRLKIGNVERVLDLGAAPGGWAEFLSQKAKLVVAVDPGELKVRKPNIVHIRKKVEEAESDIKTYAPFDMITCDINWHPQEVAKLVLHVAPYIKRGGRLIMTIKLLKGKLNEVIEETKRILSSDFENFNVFWLLANTKRERTLVAQKKGNL